MDVDDALSHLGRFGRWQMFTYTLVCLSVTVSGCWHMMSIVFTGTHCSLLLLLLSTCVLNTEGGLR